MAPGSLKDRVTLGGTGVHSGRHCRVRILPAPAGSGIRFVRVDLEGAPEIPVQPESICQEPLLRQTVLRAPERPEAEVRTVEHLLAVLHAFGVREARIEMDSAEAPILDGSAGEIARAVARVGVEPAPADSSPALTRPLAFRTEGERPAEYAAWPSEGLTISYFLKYDHPLIGSQGVSFRVEPDYFTDQVAPARTFCLAEELEYLREKGLIRGGSAENAIVVGRDRILNTELLWPDEMARHKALDLIGDLYLLGLPLRGHFLSFRGGHQSNAQFVRFLRKELQAPHA